MLRKKTAVLLAGLLVLCLALPCASAATGRKPVVGIAWRADTDSEFYTNICAAVTAAGGEPVLLAMVVDADLEYADGRIADCGLTENGFLTEEYAGLVKRNTYHNSNVTAVMAGIDAVIFTGGEDISPTLCLVPEKEHNIEAEKDYNATRDVSDYLLMAYCIDTDTPVMGFCRGMQMLAVVSGASMIQDLPTFYAENGLTYGYGHRNEMPAEGGYRDYAPHNVAVADTGSLLYAIFGRKVICGVPSWHHQAVRSTEGTALAVTGTVTIDGFTGIEVIERMDKSFIIGFQFHPEAAFVKHQTQADNADLFMSEEESLAIFTYFVDHCMTGQIAAAA